MQHIPILIKIAQFYVSENYLGVTNDREHKNVHEFKNSTHNYLACEFLSIYTQMYTL